MGNLTLLQLSFCKESDVHTHGNRADEKAAQTCVVRWDPPVPALAPAYRTLPAAPPTAVPLPRSVSQATTLPGDNTR